MFFARPDDVSLPPVIYSMLLCVTSYSKLLVSLYGVWLRLIINQLGWSRKHCSAFVTPFNVCLFCLIILIKRKRPNRGLPVSEKPLMQFGWCNMRLQGIFHPNTSSDPLVQMGGKNTHTHTVSRCENGWFHVTNYQPHKEETCVEGMCFFGAAAPLKCGNGLNNVSSINTF